MKYIILVLSLLISILSGVVGLTLILFADSPETGSRMASWGMFILVSAIVVIITTVISFIKYKEWGIIPMVFALSYIIFSALIAWVKL